jgi:hypothetical protein
MMQLKILNRVSQCPSKSAGERCIEITLTFHPNLADGHIFELIWGIIREKVMKTRI